MRLYIYLQMYGDIFLLASFLHYKRSPYFHVRSQQQARCHIIRNDDMQIIRDATTCIRTRLHNYHPLVNNTAANAQEYYTALLTLWQPYVELTIDD